MLKVELKLKYFVICFGFYISCLSTPANSENVINKIVKLGAKVAVEEAIKETLFDNDKNHASLFGHNDYDFSNYPAYSSYSGSPAKVILKTSQERNFRTRLRETQTMPVNFAGEYVFNSWGCGTGCSAGAAVSHRTGHVVFFGDTYNITDCDYEFFDFKPNSRLFKVFGPVDDEGNQFGFSFYEFTDYEFKLIKRVAEPTCASPRY